MTVGGTRIGRILAGLALAGLILPLSACEMVRVTVVIPSFDSAAVEGVTFWRAARDGFEEDGQLVFEGTEFRDGHEVVRYRYRSCDGELARVSYEANVERPASDSDVVVLQLHYPRRAEPGVFRVSTFNRAGHSPLTDTAAEL